MAGGEGPPKGTRPADAPQPPRPQPDEALAEGSVAAGVDVAIAEAVDDAIAADIDDAVAEGVDDAGAEGVDDAVAEGVDDAGEDAGGEEADPPSQPHGRGATIVWEETSRDAGGRTGTAVIGDLVKHLPNSPGVYRMMNAAGDVLYVGKAKSLKARVSNYARGIGHSNRIVRMIRETAGMEFVRTRTETEALLLEANLIKRLRPRYNVLLRDDKSFPYIVLTSDHRAPALFKHRGARSRSRDYYGPFASAGAVNRTINALQRAFLLRTCTDSVFESRTRPCLLYQIRRCSGPCTGEIDEAGYRSMVGEARDFLEGRSNAVKQRLVERMQAASETLDFETAAIARDRLAALSHVQGAQGVNPRGVDDADVFAVGQDSGQTCIQVFFFRTGQNWGNRSYFPRADRSLEPGEVLSAFIAQFYDDKPIPALLLVSDEVEECDLLAAALSEAAGHRVRISRPQRGEKLDLVRHAALNAREALARKLADTATQTALLEGVAKAFDLPAPPRRIEVYDNSHIMGTNAVGAMVVAGPEGFSKAHYRKFNIRADGLTPGDDFGMMREVMQRRFSRLKKEAGERPAPGSAEEGTMPPWPDLVLIDGGAGQLSAVRGVLEELELADAVPLVAIAKGLDRDAGRERFFRPGREPFTLPPRDPVLYFVQRLRDEAHRFAIGSHRARRKRELVKSPLDEIAGIGPTRKRALLHHFGTAKAIGRAALADLKAVDGISEQMAQAIYDHFNAGASR